MSKSDREICEAATDGYRWLVGENPCDEYVSEQQPGISEFITHFNQHKVTQMLDDLEAKDKRIEELEGALMAFIDTCDSGYDEDGCFSEDYSKAKDALK